jgi:hypothetical protein
MLPLGFTDEEMDLLITLATALPPASRDGFLQLVVSAEARWNAALRVRVPLRYRQTEQKCA